MRVGVQWTRYDGVDMVTLIGMAAGVVGLGAEDRDRLLGDRPWPYASDGEPILNRWLRRLGLRVEIFGRIATIRALRVKRHLCGDLAAPARSALAGRALRGDANDAAVLADDLECAGDALPATWWRTFARSLSPADRERLGR